MGCRDDPGNVVQHDKGDDVSSHADTIHAATHPLLRKIDAQRAENDALLTENQRLQVELDAAIERYKRYERALYPMSHEQADILEKTLREALAGDTE